MSAVELSEWTLGPGFWWVAGEYDRLLGQRMSGAVYALGDEARPSAWVASGPRVRVAEPSLATAHPTARAAAEAAYRREGAVRDPLRAVAAAAPGIAVRAFDGNAYHADPARWRVTWAESLERGRRVMGGATVDDFLACWSVSAGPWLAAAAAFCRAFPALWLEVEEAGHWRYHVRWRTDHTEFLAWVGLQELTYVADAEARTLALVEND